MEAQVPPTKRLRNSTGPRLRSGCLACKQSHVKCTESRPTCDRCVRAGTSCVYPDPSRPAKPRRKRNTSQVLFRTPLTPTSRSSLSLLTPTTRNLDDVGYSVLRFFHERTLPTISYFLPANFWTGTLLQMSESIPAIKHCILALGSWHLAAETQAESGTPTAVNAANNALQFAEDSHTEAISNLTRDITGNNSVSSPIDVAVTASVLLAIYASLRGDRTQLVTHVRLGLNLAKQSTGSISLASVVEFNRRQLALLRLEEEMRAPIFDSLRISAEDTLADVLPSSPSEYELDSVSIDAFAADVLNMGNAVYRFARTCNRGLYIGDQSAMFFERGKLEKRCNELRAQIAYTCFSGNERLAANILRARLELSWIMLQAGWTLVQTSFDSYESNFESILRIGEEVLQPVSSKEQRLPFSVNLGLIPILFYVARLCRHPVLRRKAADLLDSCPTIEGMWNAREAAAVARFVIALEEDCGDQKYIPGYDYTINEERRIHSLRYGKSMIDGAGSTMEMLDVTVMTRPQTDNFALRDVHYRIPTEYWRSGRGDLHNVNQL